MAKPIISADSHITEPPGCYKDNIESKFADVAPHVTEMGELGDVFVIDGLATPVPLGLVAAAGMNPKDIKTNGVKFEHLHRSGWDPKSRKADQE